ncbi:HET domain-containing protein [Microdochium nivale]|nr:HET domain-containing protein [Microdochium nivale]
MLHLDHLQLELTRINKARTSCSASSSLAAIMPAYLYHPLSPGKIRLIELHPGHGNDALIGELHAVSLKDYKDNDTSPGAETQSFEALSYVWGSDAKSHVLTTLSGGDVPLTASLHSFLIRLRRPDRPRVLWADGICINQTDTREKEQQVPLMAVIYRCASGMVADLGEALLPESKRVVKFIDRYWRIAVSAGGHPSMFGRYLSPHETAMFLGIPPCDVDLNMVGEKTPSADDAVWKLTFGLFDSPWFRRLWIIQEFVLAQDVTFYHGTSTFDWRHLYAMLLQYADTLGTQLMTLWADPDREVSTGLELFGTMAYQRGLRQLQQLEQHAKPNGNGGAAFLDGLTLNQTMQRARTARWFDLLQWYRQSSCTLERDRFYALLGVASDADEFAGHVELTPDYTTDNAALNLRIGKFLITRQPPAGDGREVFMRAGLATQKDVSAPSWMQDFARFQCDNEGDDELFGQAALYSNHMAAGPDSVFAVIPAPELGGDVIRFRGHKVDNVLGVAMSRADEQSMSLLDRLSGYACDAFQMFSARVTAAHLAVSALVVDRDCLEAMVRTITAELWSDTKTRDMSVLVLGFFLTLVSREEQFEGFPDWKTLLAGVLQSAYGHPIDLTIADGSIAVSSEVKKHAIKSFLGHIFRSRDTGIKAAITREGPFANVPAISEPGDEIWIISGCKLPVVLRKSVQREGMFRLVGVCYAHGAMDGSVLLREGFAFRDVLLC